MLGIVLIVIELRQTKALVEAQLQSDYWAGAADRSIVQMGDEAAESVAKACRGESLSDKDIVVLVNKYQLHMTLSIRQKAVNEIAGFGSDAWERKATGQYLQIFETTHGRTWWKTARPVYAQFGDGTLIAIGDRVLAKAGDLRCMGFETESSSGNDT